MEGSRSICVDLKHSDVTLYDVISDSNWLGMNCFVAFFNPLQIGIVFANGACFACTILARVQSENSSVDIRFPL